MANKLVIVPTYNEIKNIERIVRAVMGQPMQFDLLIVDDNSPDGTAGIIKRLQSEGNDNRLYLLERSGKLGLGTAYIAGFHWALERPQYDMIFEMDADFSHNPDDLPKLAMALESGADVAIGSRYVTGVNVVNWPMGRVLMSYYASKYVRIVTGLKIKDTTAGFIGYRRQVLETISLDEIKFKGYAFQIEMKFTAWKHGFELREVPIIFTDRTEGESKMSKKIFKEAIWGVISIKMKSWFRKYKQVK